MGGGSGGGTQYVKSETSTSNLPEYARPYFEGLMGGAQGLLSQNYTPYSGQRIADFSPEQTKLQQDVAGMQTPGQFGTATGLTSAAGLGSLMGSQYTPGQFRAQQIGQPKLQQYGMEEPQVFGVEQAQRYMSPYTQQALEPQMREAVTSAKRGQLTQDLGAVRQGTYGGSRQLLASMERERNLGQQLGDIEARGMQSAYENAQSQFERDRAAGMSAGQQNLQGALQTQQLGAQTGLAALQSNQQSALEAQRLAEQSRQFGSQQGLAGLAQAGQMGQTLSNIGSAQSQADQARYGLQQSTAAQQQALSQQYLDTAYQDFLRQRDYPLEMLQQYSSLLRGVPVTPETTKTTYAPTPGIGQQLLGGGLQAASIYKTFAGA